MIIQKHGTRSSILPKADIGLEKIRTAVSKVVTFILIIITCTGLMLGVLFAFGVKPYVVQSGSMEPAIHTGGVAFVNTKANFYSVKEGDVIAFMTEVTPVTHRVYERDLETIRTKGDANKDIDGFITRKENFIGKTVFSVPLLGYLIRYMQTKYGKLIAISAYAFLLLIDILISQDEKEDEKEDQQEPPVEMAAVPAEEVHDDSDIYDGSISAQWML